ncbi:MAG: Calx-beta domain-containing protein [Acidimicrobiales bacterium]|nr:Calx-beta domain-containing protein [Acidimicrobiales bacterium]
MKRQMTMLLVLALVAVGVALWQPWVDDTLVVDIETDRAIAEVVSVRTLTDEITVRGELRRDELQVINSAVDGKISDVLVEDGDTVQPGDVLFALDGRRAVAVNGDFAFYRRLDVGSEGPDVRQLEMILSEKGYDVGVVDDHYTEETRAGLATWQVDHDYGGATPEVDEVVTVSLSGNAAGYSIGARNTVTVEIGAVIGLVDDDPEDGTTTTTTVAPSVPTTTTPPLDQEVVLLAEFRWNEQGDRVRVLQDLLGLTPDGTYGPATRAAHLAANRSRGLSLESIPSAFSLSSTSAIVTEAGSTTAITISLGTAPTSDVVLSVTSSDAGEVIAWPSTLTFTSTDWSTEQTVALIGIDDRLLDGEQSSTVIVATVDESSDNAFDGAIDVDVSVMTTDDDTAGFTVSRAAAAVTEAGSTTTFTAVLDAQPATDVVLSVTSSNTGEATVAPATLTFTTDNWSTEQVVTATGVNDSDADGNRVTAVAVAVVDAGSDDSFDSLGDRSTRVTTIDDEAAGFTLWTTATSVSEDGTSDTFTVVLNKLPAGDVVISIESADTGEATLSPATLTFTVENWSTPQTVTVSGVDDTVVDGEQSTALTVSVVDVDSDDAFDALSDQTVTAATEDDDTAAPAADDVARATSTIPSITVEASAAEISEGDQVTFTFAAQPVPEQDLIVDISVGGEVTAEDDFNEVDDSILFPAGIGVAELIITTLIDDDLEPDEDLDVAISPLFGDNPRYNVGGRSESTVTVTDPNVPDLPVLVLRADADSTEESGSAGFTVETPVEVVEDIDVYFVVGGTVTEDEDYGEPDEFVTLTTGSDSVAISITLRSDDLVEVDEVLTVTLVPDPNHLPGFVDQAYELSWVVSASMLVESDDLPELTLEGGGVVVEGETGVVTIVADQAAEVDTSVNYSVSGSAQQGVDFEVLTGTALLRAGQISLDIPIRTIDDDVVFEPADMIVADWPARIGTVWVDEGEFVLQGKNVLNLTEPDFTIKIFASPSERAKLSVGQVVTVNLAAGDQESPGVITELDDSASTDGGSETYEGVVEATEDLVAVDGAVVTMDVVVEEAVDVIVIPIAAVLADSGANLVRVVTPDGLIERRQVETGMLDGAYVEIESGLSPGEYVILEIDRR